MPRLTTRFRRRYPELHELSEQLVAFGIEDGGAPAIVLALSVGAEWYADALASNAEAWERFKLAFDAMREGRGYVPPDETTIGALAWVVLEGERFTDAVSERLSGRPMAATIH